MQVSDALYEAIQRRETRFDGRLFIGIRTTGIVCFPSCRSRLPKRGNIEAFSNLADALHAGYRPCKRCRPDASVRMTPEMLLAHEVEAMLRAQFPQPLALSAVADSLHVSPRQLSRLLKRVWGFNSLIAMYPKLSYTIQYG